MARAGHGDRVSIAWAAVRNGRVVARATTVAPTRNGTQVVRWTLPRAAVGARIVTAPVLLRTRGVAATSVVGTPAASR